MFDATQDIQDSSAAFDAARAFAGSNREAILEAANLLGDRHGLRLAETVIERLRQERSPSKRTMRRLDELLDLLMLRHVHDPGRIEAACFAAIDPADPSVEEICLLADQLGELVADARRASTASRRVVA